MPPGKNFCISHPRSKKFKEHESLKSKCRVIARGVDRTHFFPTEGDKTEAKRRAFPDQPHLWNAPVILNGNRPWQRKRLDLTLEGFARFLEINNHEIYLYLHLPNASDEDRKILEQKNAELGIENNVVMRNCEWLSVEDLNAIYNACEVGINTAMGEGWGLISCEHAATGAAQIVTGDEQMRDIRQTSAVYAETKTVEKIRACPHVEYRVTDAESVAQSLNALFSDKDFLRERSHVAQIKMNDPRFDWKVIEKQWSHLFSEICENK